MSNNPYLSPADDYANRQLDRLNYSEQLDLARNMDLIDEFDHGPDTIIQALYDMFWNEYWERADDCY